MTTHDRESDDDARAHERALLEKSRTGDRTAFGALVRLHQRRIFALGLRFFGNADDADDLVQDTFLRAWRNVETLDPDRPLAPWLLRVASNRALTVLRTRGRRGGEPLDESLPATGPAADDDLDAQRLREDVERGLAALPDEARMILLLRAAEGLSYREIADALDIPIGTVMSRLARARQALRTRVRR